jgi:hypothetical protein
VASKRKTHQRFMAQKRFNELRYTAVSIHLLGLILSVGTWAFDVRIRANTPARLHPVDMTVWTVGVYCWLLGLILFVTTLIVEYLISKG